MQMTWIALKAVVVGAAITGAACGKEPTLVEAGAMHATRLAPAPAATTSAASAGATLVDTQGPSDKAVGNHVRDPWLWPFSSNSEWNTPLGSGARFAPDDAPITLDVTSGPANIHAGTWSHPVYLGRESDPERSVYDNENKRTFRVRIPVDARPDPMSDAHMYVVQPGKRLVVEMYGTKIQPDGNIVAVRAFMVDLYGTGMHLRDGSRFPGVRAMDASGFGGLIRVAELKEHHIPHAVTFLLSYERLKHGSVWPSSREDYWGVRDYKGSVPIGTLIAIPQAVDIHALGLTPSGLALAQALQDYGAYCDDSAASPGILFAAEGASEGMPELSDMRKDVVTIHKYVRPVINNTPVTPGGGGTPRQPFAPPLQ
jgi:hypothetical protein